MAQYTFVDLIRFHVLRDTRDVDTSQLPSDRTYIHQAPTVDRPAMVAEGLLPADNSQISDVEVKRYLHHYRAWQRIRNEIDPTNQLWHVVFEDQVNLLPDFMNKHLALIDNTPWNFDVGHIYVYPQQSWIFDKGQTYITLPQLRGMCAYVLSPTGVNKLVDTCKPLDQPLQDKIRTAGYVSYTFFNDFVEHIDAEGSIGDFVPFN